MATAPEPGPDTEDPANSPVRVLAESGLADADATWTIGTGAAAATFGRHAAEPVSRGPNSAVTAGGGVRLILPDNALAIAYETPDATDPLRWHHAVVFCLPEQDANRAGRTAVTELGPDTDALRPQDTAAALFDVTVLFDPAAATPEAELLVRTADPDLLGTLRGAASAPTADTAATVAGVLAGTGAHRVVRGAAGRIEVFGRPSRRSVPRHPPTAPIPDGWVPCMTLRPPHPAMDAVGHPMPFDRDRHQRFQELLVAHGDPLLGVLKADVVAAVRAGRGPEGALAGDDPAARATVAVAVRQLAFTDGTSGALAAWRSRYGAV